MRGECLVPGLALVWALTSAVTLIAVDVAVQL